MPTNNFTQNALPREQIRITNAFIKRNTETAQWRNFSGAPTRFDRDGKLGNRYFNIDLNKSGRIEVSSDGATWTPVTVDELLDRGWKVKIYDARNNPGDFELRDDYIPSANLEVKIKYHDDPELSYRDPKIFQYVNNEKIELDKETIGGLDYSQIDFIDVGDGLYLSQAKIIANRSVTTGAAYLTVAHIHIRLNMRTYDEWD